MFATDYNNIVEQIHCINPIKYGQTRNYTSGAVTKLSPYISRGVISTKQIASVVLAKGYHHQQIIPFLKELAWRDYFQQVWVALGNHINNDIKQPQANATITNIPLNIVQAKTGITAIDNGIRQLYKTGYLHNHLRMYVASICCNVANCHWFKPAQWMYYYLLDADWASNALSWQWVAGSFSVKKYLANQQNINKYCSTNDVNTFLDITYEELDHIKTPQLLNDSSSLNLQTILPNVGSLNIDHTLPTYLFNFYNLDATWSKNLSSNNILILEPSFYKAYPVSQTTITFILELAKNIQNIQVFVGEFNELCSNYNITNVHFKEHPCNRHYRGTLHARDWMFKELVGYYPSFFKYWNKCEKQLYTL